MISAFLSVAFSLSLIVLGAMGLLFLLFIIIADEAKKDDI